MGGVARVIRVTVMRKAGPMFGIILFLVRLMYLAYCGVSVLILAPCCAMLAAVLSGGAPVMATNRQVFMEPLGG